TSPSLRSASTPASAFDEFPNWTGSRWPAYGCSHCASTSPRRRPVTTSGPAARGWSRPALADEIQGHLERRGPPLVVGDVGVLDGEPGRVQRKDRECGADSLGERSIAVAEQIEHPPCLLPHHEARLVLSHR